MNEEIFKTVYGFEDYEINTNGILRNKKTGHFLKQHKTKYGYYYYVLYKNKKSHTCLMHRLIMMTFKPCENMEKLQVNHIDEDKSNNKIENLEWLSAKENNNYGTRIERQVYTQIHFNKRNKPIKCIETNEIFISISNCSRLTGIDKASIWRALNGIQKTAGNYHWEYLNS